MHEGAAHGRPLGLCRPPLGISRQSFSQETLRVPLREGGGPALLRKSTFTSPQRWSGDAECGSGSAAKRDGRRVTSTRELPGVFRKARLRVSRRARKSMSTLGKRPAWAHHRRVRDDRFPRPDRPFGPPHPHPSSASTLHHDFLHVRPQLQPTPAPRTQSTLPPRRVRALQETRNGGTSAAVATAPHCPGAQACSCQLHVSLSPTHPCFSMPLTRASTAAYVPPMG